MVGKRKCSVPSNLGLNYAAHAGHGINDWMKFDGFVKSLKSSFGVIPAKAGIQYFQIVLDACLRRHDGISGFLRVCQI
jgi:hypothetical protein